MYSPKVDRAEIRTDTRHDPFGGKVPFVIVKVVSPGTGVNCGGVPPAVQVDVYTAAPLTSATASIGVAVGAPGSNRVGNGCVMLKPGIGVGLLFVIMISYGMYEVGSAPTTGFCGRATVMLGRVSARMLML